MDREGARVSRPERHEMIAAQRDDQRERGWRAGSGTHILPFEFAADENADGPTVTVLHADGSTSPGAYLHVRDGRIDEIDPSCPAPTERERRA